MKGLIITLTTLITVAAFGAHNHDNMNMKKMKKMNKSSIKMNSSEFLLPYFAIHAKLIKDKLPDKKEIQALEKSFNKEILKNKKFKKDLKKALKYVRDMKGKDLNTLRNDFYELSKILIIFSKKYNLKGVQAYYCPMAKKSWLQNQSEITYNPYMPKKMLHCGSKI